MHLILDVSTVESRMHTKIESNVDCCRVRKCVYYDVVMFVTSEPTAGSGHSFIHARY